MVRVKLLSWNVLGPFSSDISKFESRYPKVSDWKYRYDILLRKILAFDVDVICLQEVDDITREGFTLGLELNGFSEGSYEARGEKGGVVVYYKTFKFDQLERSGKQLVCQGKLETPGSVASSALICRESGNRLFVSSLHLHWENSKDQIIELLGSIDTKDFSSCILAGDFNIPYKDMLEKIPYISDFSLFEHSSFTAQPPHNPDQTYWESLDYIMFSRNLNLDRKKSFVGDSDGTYVRSDLNSIKDISIDNIPNEDFPSDHLPLVVEFKF